MGQMAEYRISIYGRKQSEWDNLASWIVNNELYSENVVWLIQLPRLYNIYKEMGILTSFQTILDNVLIDQDSHPQLHVFLKQVVGLDLVDDESKPERRPTILHSHTQNKLRESKGMTTIVSNCSFLVCEQSDVHFGNFMESHISLYIWLISSMSFRGEDTRKTFVDHLYSALEKQGIYTYKDDETLPRGESIGPSLMKAIEESQIAVEFWRKALMDASNLSGWEPKHIANGRESKGIEQIVIEISHRLQVVTLSANENLIGIVARSQSLKAELQIGSGGVLMIGIWGVGGGGKTTLASSVYSEIYRHFDGSCFVENIREESSKNGLAKLQEQILCGVLKQKKVQGIGRVEEGRRMIQNRLRHRKVFIVLDDVDHLDQLKALAGSCDWFGDGSRIIITTRDEHLLTAHRVNVIHDISLLNEDEAIMLLCKHAPQDNRPVEDYEQLSKEVVSYAGGLPLALTILGSFLCDKDIHEWKSALERLKEIPDTDIVEKLKISFDGLKPLEKELFLDIACFYRRERIVRSMKRLNACGFHPVIGVKVLIQKALITISDGVFDMHDLVQEMGHSIVRGEHPNNPEKHSRIWKKDDVLRILAMDAKRHLTRLKQ
ncbi:unnamed protein product [Lactuca virosa]|uniref:TIR domain-containing protein n=1 Tax=Lactuca virosa TaxID=75947 RepID=A0AAU9N5J2_9ASTR|nr:unnamed protein product [Lactuca virosa]